MSQRWKDSEHLFRMAGLFAAGVFTFVLARPFFIPADFGLYGHYRAGALDDARTRPAVYAGQAACVECHTDVAEKRAPGPHPRVSCETCHGPLTKHASAPDELKPTRPDGRTTCLPCHEANRSRPPAFPQIVVADHAGEEACTACHQPHDPRIQ